MKNTIDLKQLLEHISDSRKLIAIIIIIFTLLSGIFAITLPNIYSSRALLIPSDSNEDLISKMSSLSSVANLAGISLPSEPASKSVEAIERIKSFSFFVNQILPNINLQDLIAIRKWDKVTNKLLYDNSIFDEDKNMWIDDKGNYVDYYPSPQKAYTKFQKILTVSQDRQNSFVAISIEHQSPYIAEEWVSLIVTKINETMRNKDEYLASSTINFLNDKYSSTKIEPIQDGISALMESQLKALMLVSIQEDYVFRYIDQPIVAEDKSSPARLTIVIIGFIFGVILGIVVSILSLYKNKILSK